MQETAQSIEADLRSESWNSPKTRTIYGCDFTIAQTRKGKFICRIGVFGRRVSRALFMKALAEALESARLTTTTPQP